MAEEHKKRIVVILPGWQHHTSEPRYGSIANHFREAGFKVIVHNPDWDSRNITDWINNVFDSTPVSNKNITLFGFSMGAMIALMMATRVPAENLILCSPSGYFREYTPLLDKEDLEWARENIKDFEDISINKLYSQLAVQNGYIIAGDKEFSQWPDFKQWINDLHSHTNWPLTIVPDTGHEIEAVPYQQTVKEIILKLKASQTS